MEDILTLEDIKKGLFYTALGGLVFTAGKAGLDSLVDKYMEHWEANQPKPIVQPIQFTQQEQAYLDLMKTFPDAFKAADEEYGSISKPFAYALITHEAGLAYKYNQGKSQEDIQKIDTETNDKGIAGINKHGAFKAISHPFEWKDMDDFIVNVQISNQYLMGLEGNILERLSQYNAGPGNINNLDYASKVLGHAEIFNNLLKKTNQWNPHQEQTDNYTNFPAYSYWYNNEGIYLDTANEHFSIDPSKFLLYKPRQRLNSK